MWSLGLGPLPPTFGITQLGAHNPQPRDWKNQNAESDELPRITHFFK